MKRRFFRQVRVHPSLRLQAEAKCPETAAILMTAMMATPIRTRPLRAQFKPTSAKQLLPRIVEPTEPIICSRTAAIPGRQSASAFATQYALRDARIC
jgi:hypothetical protein